MEPSRQKHQWVRILGKLSVVVFVAFAFVASLVWFLVGKDLPTVRYDLTRHLGAAAELVTNRTVAAHLKVTHFSLLPRPLLKISAKIDLEGSPFAIGSTVEWRAGRGWVLAARLNGTSIDESSPFLAPAIDRLLKPVVPEFKFGGQVSGEFEAVRTNADGIVRWTANARIRDFSAQGAKEDVSVDVQGLNCRLSASGLANHVDLAPIRPRIELARFNQLMISNVMATALFSESRLLVTEASAGFCGGFLRLYSLALDLNRSSLWATVLAEDLDAGEVLKLVRGFQGSATGHLHGKLRFSRGGDGLLRFRDAYLYSIPGEQGTLRMRDSADFLSAVVDNCLGGDERRNLERALAALDYSALKVRLDKASRENSTLNFKINGSVESGEVRAPVNLDITCRGSIEQLINTGLNFNKQRR